VEVGEPHALLRERVEVRRFKSFRAETADIAVTLIVGEDQDDVRRIRRGYGGCEEQ
jgi:hypothetical protein